MSRLAVAALLGVIVSLAPTSPRAAEEHPGFLLTIFLKHDQSRPLGELQEQLKKTGFAEQFPPKGIEVVSWYVMMGIGQVVTVRVPAERLREVNLAIEKAAWGAYRTEFYATYDFRPVWQAEQEKRKAN